ncbi:XRE family transcriptional regulator [Roseospira marina]|nr:LexA family transcriptional regulator [Roseospira marina]MBB5087475.1 phage repressor protein C with HTH and peptisase S24 domain [Roseospira marina]
MDTTAARLRQARQQAGYATATDAALAFGWNPNTYKSHENGLRGLRGHALERYAGAFGVPPAWLQFGDGAGVGDRPAVRSEPGAAPGGALPGFADEPGEAAHRPHSQQEPQHGHHLGLPPDPAGVRSDVPLDQPYTDGLVGARDLPVYGSALGGPDGEMIVSFEPIEWVRRPAPLEGVKGGFGFYMIGESMSPAFEPGDMILCHPTRPPFSGQDVLVIRRLNGGQHALVKRLVRIDGEGLRLRQFNPPHDFDVPCEDVVSFHLVVGKYSRR